MKYPSVEELKDRYIFLRKESSRLRKLEYKFKERRNKEQQQYYRHGLFSSYTMKHDNRNNGYYFNRHKKIDTEIQAIETTLKVIHGWYPGITPHIKKEKITNIKTSEELGVIYKNQRVEPVETDRGKSYNDKYDMMKDDTHQSWNVDLDQHTSQIAYKAVRTYIRNDDDGNGEYEAQEPLIDALVERENIRNFLFS